jgi:hypothetical protein
MYYKDDDVIGVGNEFAASLDQIIKMDEESFSF